jgi:hypothetical protein
MEGLLAIYKDTIRKKLILTSEVSFEKISREGHACLDLDGNDVGTLDHQKIDLVAFGVPVKVKIASFPLIETEF